MILIQIDEKPLTMFDWGWMIIGTCVPQIGAIHGFIALYTFF
jgi:hypothetical protein